MIVDVFTVLMMSFDNEIDVQDLVSSDLSIFCFGLMHYVKYKKSLPIQAQSQENIVLI